MVLVARHTHLVQTRLPIEKYEAETGGQHEETVCTYFVASSLSILRMSLDDPAELQECTSTLKVIVQLEASSAVST